MLGLAGAAFAIGLTGAMTPGSYLTLTIARTMRNGRLSAMLMLVGHALVEALLLVGFAFGLQAFLRQPAVSRVFSLAGGTFLIWMAADLLVGIAKGRINADFHAAEKPSRLGPVAQGAVVSLSNPYWLLWWVTIGAALASQGLAYGPAGVASFYIGHELADVVWYGALIMAVSKGRHLLSDRVYRAVMGALAVFLLLLGARFAWVGIAAFLR
jgi:threonine/homoserine/homoserine lactone efflux protein